ncbi:hypothetical protein [Escherichia phage vB_EcoM_JNE01]|nr:hypothetical protein [Escherichia phage vB_EcoM_JNE01]
MEEILKSILQELSSHVSTQDESLDLLYAVLDIIKDCRYY